MADRPPRRKTFPTVKPYPTFPLSPRADGRFAKKVKGVYHVFGSGGDWEAALREYHRAVEHVHAGRPIPAVVADAVTVKQCANLYLAERRSDVRAGTLTLGSWDDYRAALATFASVIGAGTRMGLIGPDDLTRFGQHLRDKLKLGSYAYNRNRALVFAWLKYSAAAEWIKPVNVGVGFKKIPTGKMRADRKPRLFTAEQIKRLLAAAKPQMRAMILLGLNGGFGGKDCSDLPRIAIDLKAKVIRFARPKTHIARTVTLWPETAKAIKSLLAQRPGDPLLFRTKHGNPWVRETASGKRVITKDSVSDRFGRLLRDLGLKEHFKGVGFYALRHTFNTYANEVRDSDARLHLMGRKLPGIDGDTYVEGIFLPRLKAVTDHVRRRLIKAVREIPRAD